MPVAEDAIRARQGIRPAAFAHNALERLIDVLYAVFELAVLDRQFFGDDVRASRNVWEREGLRSTVWLI
jgi:hypothetical protein